MRRFPRTFMYRSLRDGPFRVLGTFVIATLLSPASAFAEALIVVAGPASGPYAERTQQIEAGAKQAAAQLNAETGTDFAVETVDDGCDDAKASGVARALVAKGVRLVLGHPCASAALAAAQIYGKSETVFIATATRHPDLTGKRAGPSVFRLAGHDGKQGETAAQYMLQAYKGRTLAIVHDRTRFAKTIAEQAIEMLKAAKATVIAATVVGGDKEYNRLVAKLKGADAVFFAGFPLEAGFILQALRHAGSEAHLIVSDSVVTAEFTQSFADVAKGVTALMPRLPDVRGGPAATPGPDARLPEALGPDAIAAYAGVQVFASALARTAATDPKGNIAEALTANEHKSAAGAIRFNEAGDANVPDYAIVTWDGVAWVSPSNAPVSTTAR